MARLIHNESPLGRISMTGGFRNKRKEETRHYKRLFLIASEGKKTEKSYFERNIRHLIDESNVRIKFVDKSTHASSPLHVQKALASAIEKESDALRTGDEAWIVIDRDQWEKDDLIAVHEWTQEKSTDKCHRDLALSNPCFEYWLILHFEDGNDLSTTAECQNRLKNHINLIKEKNVPQDSIQRVQVEAAIKRAKNMSQKRYGETNQPVESGCTGTTVYRLVEKLLEPTPG